MLINYRSLYIKFLKKCLITGMEVIIKMKKTDNNETTKIKISKYECWYASLIYTMFAGHSVDIRLEKADSFGRSDMIVIL